MIRIPIIRRDRDGTVVDGTARALQLESGTGMTLDDFRDLDGQPLALPAGASFEVQLAGGPDAEGSLVATFPSLAPARPDAWPDPDQHWLGSDFERDVAPAPDGGFHRVGSTLRPCTAAIRPFRPTNDAEVRCSAEGDHDVHQGPLRDYAFPGSVTEVQWLDNDRRTFRGAWPGPCPTDPACNLPAHHPRSCST